MPLFMFQPLAKGRKPTLEHASELGQAFSTSLTATAIRLVTSGELPSIAVLSDIKRGSWPIKSPDLPRSIRVHDRPTSGSFAADLLGGRGGEAHGEVMADAWLSTRGSEHYELWEESRTIRPGRVLTLLSWRDESQLLDLEEECE